MDPAKDPSKDRPWLMRTYAGYSSARESNALYRLNLSRGQTGLSVAFDLPTQTGYDPDHPMALGEVGKVGVSIAHIEDMELLFDEIPLDQMNTSMTINGTAAWLLALYVAVAQRREIELAELRGTIQNDIIKEYLSRGLYLFPPAPSLRLIVDTIAFTIEQMPRWNPINVCSYHLQEAGATPVQELAFALSTALGVLDAVQRSGQVSPDRMPRVVGRLSFFVNAGIRFIEETCKMRAFVEMWDRIARERYNVEDPKLRRFRYGVQVNSLGLTEQQPENNLQRIVLQSLGVLLSKKARARALQLPAWNEAIGLPRPWDQQWALRIQQVMAYETDLLEYEDIFEGSLVIENKVGQLVQEVWQQIEQIEQLGGIVPAVESGYLKRELVRSQVERMRAIERGEQIVVGLNRFTESADSPLTSSVDGGFLHVDPQVERELVQGVQAYRQQRADEPVKEALARLRHDAKEGANIMEASIACAHAGVTTGEWSDTLRQVFGEYRAPTGIDISSHTPGEKRQEDQLRQRVQQTNEERGRRLRFLVAKPGLEGHSNGAEQIALKARDIGMEVLLGGIRQSAREIVHTVRDESIDLLGLSMLSGSHIELSTAVLSGLRQEQIDDVVVVAGGIIPPQDHERLRQEGIHAIFTPKDSDLNDIMAQLIDLVRQQHNLSPLGALNPPSV